MAVTDDAFVPGLQSHSASLDLDCSAEDAFALLCAVEKWPVWLSFSAQRATRGVRWRIDARQRSRHSFVASRRRRRSSYEVDGLIANYRLSLVGAYSLRRRFEFRIERRTTSRAASTCGWPIPPITDGSGRFSIAGNAAAGSQAPLDDSLVHFKGLVEYNRDDAVLADF